MARRDSAAAAGAGAGAASKKRAKKTVSLRFLFANHDEVKPLELPAVPLSLTVLQLKLKLLAQWPVGLADGAAAGGAPSTPIPAQKAAEPQAPATPVSINSPPPTTTTTAAAAAGVVGGEATDDELEEDLEDLEEGAGVTTPPPPAPVFPAPSAAAVEPARIRLFCLGRGLDDEGKRLKDVPIPVFDDHPTPVQVAIRPAAAMPSAARRKTLEGGAHGVGGGGIGEEEGMDPLLAACCGCSVM